MVAEKKKRLGKKSVKNLTKIETGELKRVTPRKLELSEIRHNLWRQYRDGGKMIRPAVPEGWKRMDGNRAGNTLMDDSGRLSTVCGK